MFDRAFGTAGRWLARYLNRRIRRYEAFAVSRPDQLHAVLRPGDVLLVEGDRRVSTAIKYLTQSTWSHAALHVGDYLDTGRGIDAPTLIEADMQHGVHTVGLDSVAGLNTRICRPVGLDPAERRRVCQFAIDRIGLVYDLRNIIDLARYLLPVPPVPAHWRRRMIALGSGDPTRAICSTLIAQAFQSVRYPILPRVDSREVLHIRHHSLFTPRDFDLSPYFRVIKPEVEIGFDHRQLRWGEPDGG